MGSSELIFCGRAIRVDITNQQQTAVQYTALLCACYLLQTTALLERGLGACKAACYVYAKKYLWSGNLRAPMQFF